MKLLKISDFWGLLVFFVISLENVALEDASPKSPIVHAAIDTMMFIGFAYILPGVLHKRWQIK